MAPPRELDFSTSVMWQFGKRFQRKKAVDNPEIPPPEMMKRFITKLIKII
jgi:hypothetical protein